MRLHNDVSILHVSQLFVSGKEAVLKKGMLTKDFAREILFGKKGKYFLIENLLFYLDEKGKNRKTTNITKSQSGHPDSL